MLHNDKVTLVFVWYAEVVQEGVGGLAHHHGAEELASEPGTASGRDAGLDDGDLQIGTLLGELVGGAQPARSGTDDNDVRLSVVVEVGEVATSY